MSSQPLELNKDNAIFPKGRMIIDIYGLIYLIVADSLQLNSLKVRIQVW